MKRSRSSLSNSFNNAQEHYNQNQQRIELRGTDNYLVVNSPYGANREKYGWGNLFQPPISACIPGFPNIHIGISSLNAVPGKDRRMHVLLTQYKKKFNCLEHCYPYHDISEESKWKSWKEMGSSLSINSNSSLLNEKEGTTTLKKEQNITNENNLPKEGKIKKDDEEYQNSQFFIFTIKANQYLTHTRMLAMDDKTEEHIQNFFIRRCSLLENHLGPVLLQLPPQFHKTPENIKRVESFALHIPKYIRIAVEFRSLSWYNEETYQLLRRLAWALVVAHHHTNNNNNNNNISAASIHIDTGVSFMYVRLHGILGPYAGDYGPILMSQWAERIVEFINGGISTTIEKEKEKSNREVFFFLNNSNSQIGGTTSSTVDATFLAERVKALLVKEKDVNFKSSDKNLNNNNKSISPDIDDVITISD